MKHRHVLASCAFLLFLLAAALRVDLAGRHGLWADEVFSIAISTGHSLEHPALAADPDFGDFIEPSGPIPAGEYRRYLEHEEAPAGLERVCRAVLLSDTNPPLYYLLLNYWMRWFGTGDGALRFFSIFWAMACFPLIWSLARRIGGRPALVPTAVLFVFSPICLCYSTEGRMYSLLWFLVLCLVRLTLTLDRRGPGFFRNLLWILAAACGFMTHYYFAFVWLVCVLWLFLRHGRFKRRRFKRRRFKRKFLVSSALVTILLILPWYRLIPESLSGWRVTHDWLHGYPTFTAALLSPLKLGFSLVSNRNWWGGSLAADLVLLIVVAVLAAVLLRKLSWRVISGHRKLVFLWGFTACIGPPVFDLIRQTSSSLKPRYALAGLPAALLLLGFGLGRLKPRYRLIVLLVILAAWFPGNKPLYLDISRDCEPYREVGAVLTAWAEPTDLVLVHSIPSGVLGIARYLPADTAVASWVGQLGRRRIPEDLERLIAGRRRVVLVDIHAVGEPAPEEDWLRENARLDRKTEMQAARLLFFSLRQEESKEE